MIWEHSSLKIAELEDVMIILFLSYIHLCRVSILLCVHNVLTKCLAESGWLCLEENEGNDEVSVCWCAEKQKLDKESQCWRGKITSLKQFYLIAG